MWRPWRRQREPEGIRAMRERLRAEAPGQESSAWRALVDPAPLVEPSQLLPVDRPLMTRGQEHCSRGARS
jgi:hypothetical protein